MAKIGVNVGAGGDEQGEGTAVGPQHWPEAFWRSSPGPLSGRGKLFSLFKPVAPQSGLGFHTDF